MTDALDAKPAENSVTAMTEIVLPSDSNPMGALFGGKLMQWIDVCAAIAAQRHTRRVVVTASMDEVHFHAPIKTGMVAALRSCVTAAFKHSVEVVVDVHSEDPLTGDRQRCCSAYVTFAAIDRNGRPTRVHPIALDTDEAKRLQAEGEARRKKRLANRAGSAIEPR